MISDDRAWWTSALAGESPLITEEAQPGFYRRRLVKGGPFVPVHIWIERDVDDAGDLVSDERIMCSVNGRIASAEEHWTYCCSHPIAEPEFDYLTRLSSYARAKEGSREPLANPRKKINPLSFPLPDVAPKKRIKRK